MRQIPLVGLALLVSANAQARAGPLRVLALASTCSDPVFAHYAPYAPLDVDAFVRPKQNKVVVTWSAPDQSGCRQIVRFEIERVRREYQREANVPVVTEGQIPGPNGNQSADTKLSFTFVSSVLQYPTDWGFRVCSANDVGRTCTNDFAWVHEKSFNVFSQPSNSQVPIPPSHAASDLERTNMEENQPTRFGPNTPVVGEPGGFAGPAPTMTGMFHTDFGELVLRPREGTYGVKNGHVTIAHIYGDFMDGTWTQSESGQKCADGTYGGRFHFRFNANGFTGSYGYCDGPVNAGAWNGWRR